VVNGFYYEGKKRNPTGQTVTPWLPQFAWLQTLTYLQDLKWMCFHLIYTYIYIYMYIYIYIHTHTTTVRILFYNSRNKLTKGECENAREQSSPTELCLQDHFLWGVYTTHRGCTTHTHEPLFLAMLQLTTFTPNSIPIHHNHNLSVARSPIFSFYILLI
jgi:hypothetical protein